MGIINHKTNLLFGIILILVLNSCNRRELSLVNQESQQYLISDRSNSEVDSGFVKLLIPYHQELGRIMDQNLVYSTQELTKGLPESALGDYFADACLKEGNRQLDSLQLAPATCSFFNSGGIRTSLPKGYVKVGNIYELMPFENELVMIELDSIQLDKLTHYIASKGGSPISGFRLRIDKQQNAKVELLNVSYSEKNKVRLITSDYLANGGDNCTFLKESKFISLNLKVRDGLIRNLLELVLKNDSLKVVTDGRILIN
jgi:2',3'-cyclic-nucleotide 2'-phosphodiesterase (5'-nucleotidase family)